MNKRNNSRRANPRRNALVIALAVGLGFTGFAYGQATTGVVFGSAPAGDTVTATGATGVQRSATVGADGRYTISNLPVGKYTVTLQDNGQTVSTRNNIQLTLGAGTQVQFAGGGAQNAQELGAVTVSANALPAIDVSSVSSSTTLDAQELQQLPISHSAESIALLAPGTVAGSGYFGNAVSFGGSGVTENAYYVNGFNTTNIYNYTSSTYQLPYGAIAQQQTFTGGYGAKYGRSDGGVINQVGKRGTNEWHFGARVLWAPRYLQASPKNLIYPYQNTPEGYVVVNPELQGQLRRYRNANKTWTTEYSAYVGGPLIKDKLFMYVAADFTKSQNRSVATAASGTDQYYSNRESNYYGKLDWNITDNNIVELTALKDTQNNGAGTAYFYDNDTKQDTDLIGANDVNKFSTKGYIAHYTGYLTDDLTLSVLYGKLDVDNPILYPFVSDKTPLRGLTSQNPAYTGGSPIVNNQQLLYSYSPEAAQHSHGLRADLSYQLGDHLIEGGIDNVTYSSTEQGQMTAGPGYAWIYAKTGDPNAPLNDTLGVGAPGQTYFVYRYQITFASSMGAKQKAYYLQDAWQVTPNLLLNIGLRNDHFSNSNNFGQDFVDEKNQWEPRLGFSWDVYGDSSFKVYGNAGRYYLALPQSVALRAATPSTFTSEYFTYTGIDADGNPTGRTPVPGVDGAPPPGPVSANAETGTPVDPTTVTATDLKPQYQDEYILGFDKTLGPNWVYGAKGTYRNLGAAIDDVCAVGLIGDKIQSMGLDADDYLYADPGCRIFNPGMTNSFKVKSAVGGDPISVSMSTKDWGFRKGAIRKYYGLDLYLQHPFDGKWFARIDYTFSRNWGNAEGQVRSDIGQTDTSKTEDWDFASLMDGAYGLLANDRRHQIKIRGAYQIAPEWLVSGTLRIQSGTRLECLGYYGADAEGDPSGYGPDYHYCEGHRSSPGSTGSTPWTKQLNLGVRYTPAFADNKLAFAFDVFNATNEQKVLQTDPSQSIGKKTITNTYNAGIYYEQPRYMRLSVEYNY